MAKAVSADREVGLLDWPPSAAIVPAPQGSGLVIVSASLGWGVLVMLFGSCGVQPRNYLGLNII